MSYNPTSTYDAIIYRPGGTTAGDVVATWAEVKTFIQASSNGKCIVYVDDSIVSPALVDTVTGITDCLGKVEIRPYVVDSVNFTVLQVEPGATLRDLYRIASMELRCNAQNATPSLDFMLAPSGGNLILEEYGALTNASTATTTAISVAGGAVLQITGGQANVFLNNGAVPIFNVVALGLLEIVVFDASFIDANYASGAGRVNFVYDNSTASSFGTPGTPPPLPALTGTYDAVNDDNIWAQKPIDPTTFNAPADADLAIFDGPSQIWRAVAMSGDATITNAGVVTVTGGGGTLTGNVNGPLGANRFLSLVHNVVDADFAVTEVEGWTWVGMQSLTADRTVTLPAAPTAGEVVVVTDATGFLPAHNVIINGNGKTVQGNATYTMSGAQNGTRGGIALQYDGTSWEIFAAFNPGITQQVYTGPLSSAVTQNSQDVVIYVDTSAGAVNLTLPTPVTNVPTRITFRDRAGTWNTHNLTITPPGAVDINGANTPFVVAAQYAHIVAESDGTNYFI